MRVKRYHYDKLSGIKEFLERLAQDCFNNNFSPKTGTLAKNIPPLDEVNGGETVFTRRALHFSSCISPSAAARTISGITKYSSSLISIGYRHTDKI